jgi:hypothetical protein
MTEDERAVLRSMIQHEDVLRAQRLGWLLALNGFLFAALGLAWSDSDSTSLVLIVSAVGVVVALSSAAGMYASDVAIKRLRDWSRADEIDEIHMGPPLVGLRGDELKKKGGVAASVPWLYPWRMVPWSLGAAWVAVMIARLSL